MSVTIALQYQAPVPQVPQLVASLTPLMHGVDGAGLRDGSWVFQGESDPETVLYVAEWASREQFWDSLNVDGPLSQAAALSTRTVAPNFYQRVEGYQDPERRPMAARCVRVRAMPPAIAVRTYLAGLARPEVLLRPSCVVRQVYQDAETGPQFLAIRGWADPMDAEAMRTDTSRRLRWVLDGLGATVERFVARVWSRSPGPSG